MSSRKRIAVVGSGIAGLAAAHRVVELGDGKREGGKREVGGVDVVLFERNAKPGGVLETVHENGFQIEQSVDNFITTLPWGLSLCDRLGLSDRLVQTDERYRQTYVVAKGRLCKLPDGFMMMAPTRVWPLAITPILSPWGKLRAGMEIFIPPKKDEADESMATFVRRRLGREAFERLVEPLVSAVYAADMETLSVNATLSRFREMEREYGSLVRAMRKQGAQRRRQAKKQAASAQSGARHGLFVTIRTGIRTLVDEITRRLPEGAVRTNSPVESVRREADGRWRVGVGEQSELFDGVVLATPSYVTAELVKELDAGLSERLGRISHSGTAIVSMAFKESQVRHPLDGAGCVVPGVEKSPILAISFSNRKYPYRAPEGTVLLRTFVGGHRAPEMAEMDDDKLTDIVSKELDRLLGAEGKPIYTSVAHWPRTMPQYHVGHLELVAEIDEHVAKLPGLELAGNAYRGVGLPDCIHGGETAVERILETLDGTTNEGE